MTKTKLLAAAALAAAGLAAAPASAQTTIKTFTAANVTSALQQLGIQDATSKQATLADGSVTQFIYFSNGGIKHLATLEVCKPGCLGLLLMTVFTGAGSVVDPRKINEFNRSSLFGKAVTTDSALVLQRYVISDGGISMENVESNIANFVAMTGPFMQFVGGASTSTVSARPGEAGLMTAVTDADEAAKIEALSGSASNNWNTAIAGATGAAAEHVR